MGISLAITAAVTWAFGDFSIERVSRRMGSLKALFFITLAGSVILLPFVWKDIPTLASGELFGLLLLAGAVILWSAIFDFAALKLGKLSVVEPICAFEVPITAFCAYLFIGERISPVQTILILAMMAGIFLVSVKKFSHLKQLHAEKGAWFALVATLGMGIANFIFAEDARLTSPLLTNWFTSVFILIFLLGYFSWKGELSASFRSIKKGGTMSALMVGSDNVSWIAYTYAALYLPISIAIGVSESYIALAALLGFIFNKERLGAHQVVGMALCVLSVICLSVSIH